MMVRQIPVPVADISNSIRLPALSIITAPTNEPINNIKPIIIADRFALKSVPASSNTIEAKLSNAKIPHISAPTIKITPIIIARIVDLAAKEENSISRLMYFTY